MRSIFRLLALFTLFCAGVTTLQAQSKTDLTGAWQGTLQMRKSLRTVIVFAKAPKGYTARFYSIDQNPSPINATSVTQDGASVKVAMDMIGGSFEGTLSPDGNTITGTWAQNGTEPLVLVRATKETAWQIPAPPPPRKRMAADANPTFEVATIKPTPPDRDGKGFGSNGHSFRTSGTTLDDLIKFAYGVHENQILGGPDWINKDKFDIDATIDLEGDPSYQQTQSMVKKLLADRFQLSFHMSKKELSVYVLTVEKGGVKNVAKSESDAPGFSIPIRDTPGGIMMIVRNGTMTDFAGFGLQGAVLDRPVLDQTGLPERSDFVVKWMPDSSQFGGRMPIPPATDNALPGLFTALHEQLGLKLEARKAPADVLMIDKAGKPSAN